MGWIVIDGKKVAACYSREIYAGHLDGWLFDKSPVVQSFHRCLSINCQDCLGAIEAIKQSRKKSQPFDYFFGGDT